MISKNEKSQLINNCCLNYNQIVVEFHKREETKSSLYPNIRGHRGMVDDTWDQGE